MVETRSPSLGCPRPSRKCGVPHPHRTVKPMILEIFRLVPLTKTDALLSNRHLRDCGCGFTNIVAFQEVDPARGFFWITEFQDTEGEGWDDHEGSPFRSALSAKDGERSTGPE